MRRDRGAPLAVLLLLVALVAASDAATFDLRPQFHFLPPANWMNDPNGPMQYRGLYHLFYQYDATGAVGTGPKSWGHAVSEDLVRWALLPIALEPDMPYDISGVWSGSASLINGVPRVIYTGVIYNASLEFPWIEAQCEAYPSDPSDPWLVEWTKDARNPLIVQPAVAVSGFRDPTTAFQLSADGDGWYILVGSGQQNYVHPANLTGGMVLLYRASSNLTDFTLVGPAALGALPGVMWECPDLYTLMGPSGPVDVLKASVDVPYGVDMWATGSLHSDLSYTTYHTGLVDYGNTYASKSFANERDERILWGWIKEDDSPASWTARGWAGAQTLPRLVSLYNSTRLRFAPYPALAALRGRLTQIPHLSVTSAVQNLTALSGVQYELQVGVTLASAANVTLRVLADPTGAEYTDVVISVAYVTVLRAHSSLAPDANQGAQTTPVIGTNTNVVTLYVFVDHSIVEIYVNGGLCALTSRVYPTLPASQGVALFSSGGTASAAISYWPMSTIWG